MKIDSFLGDLRNISATKKVKSPYFDKFSISYTKLKLEWKFKNEMVKDSFSVYIETMGIFKILDFLCLKFL